jgi:hypothetical protein
VYQAWHQLFKSTYICVKGDLFEQLPWLVPDATRT